MAWRRRPAARNRKGDACGVERLHGRPRARGQQFVRIHEGAVHIWPAQARFSMQRERALPCAHPCSGDTNLCVRTIAAEDEPLDRVSEIIFAIAVRHEIRSPPHLRTGIAHCNAKTTLLEYRDIIAAIADDGDLRKRNSQSVASSDNATPLLASGWVRSR